MKYRIHNNGWTVILDDFDFRTATQSDINQIAKLIANNTLVVVKKQILSIDEKLRIVKMFKNPIVLFQPETEGYKSITVPNTEGLLLRVGGKLNEHGDGGIGDHVGEFVWHHDYHWQFDRSPPLLMIHAVEGVKNSVTSWTNNILAYADLNDQTKSLLSTLKAAMIKGFELNADGLTYDENGNGWFENGTLDEGRYLNILHVSKTNQVGIFFPFLQIDHFQGMSKKESREILTSISKHITQDKYVYRHEWDDGDLVLFDQYLGIHKRNRCEHNMSRLIHRAAFDYPDQDYI
jgi:alpha-ketoglutarate-dependent taurine dioxygenase